MHKCRCGTFFHWNRQTKQLCPGCLQRMYQRRQATQAMRKCQCGNVPRVGSTQCSRCEALALQHRREQVLTQLADTLLNW